MTPSVRFRSIHALLLAALVAAGSASAQVGGRPTLGGGTSTDPTSSIPGNVPTGMNLGPLETGFARSSIPFSNVMRQSVKLYEVINQEDPSVPTSSPSGAFQLDPLNGYPGTGVPKTLGGNTYYMATRVLDGYVDSTGAVRYKPGVYHVTFAGQGTLEFYGDVITPNPAPQITLLNGQTMYTIDTGAGGNEGIVIKLTSSAPAPLHVRNIRVVHTSQLGSLGDPVQTFNPDWLGLLRQLKPHCLRFARWKHVSTSLVDDWADETPVNYQTYSTDRTMGGVPYEVLIELARELDTDIWVQIPHLTGLTTDYASSLGALLQSELSKPENADINVYVEFSNEVWRDNSAPWNWGNANKAFSEPLGQFYGRTVEAQMTALTQPSAAAGLFAEGRLIRVLGGRASQATWMQDAITGMWWYKYNPSLLLPSPNPQLGKLPARQKQAPFDVIALNAYVGSAMFSALTWAEVRDWAQASPPDIPAVIDFLHSSVDSLQDLGGSSVDLKSFITRHKTMLGVLQAPQFLDSIVAYESGQALEFATSDCEDYYNLIGGGPCPGPSCPCTASGELTAVSALFNDTNRDPRIADVYHHLAHMWSQELPGNLMNLFNFVQKYGPSSQGSWGTLEWVYPLPGNALMVPRYGSAWRINRLK
jgi:hypothetical protein